VSQIPSRLTLKVFTISFREIREITYDTGLTSGDNLLQLKSADTDGLAKGIYYYVVTADSSGGNKAASKAGQFIILK
jgi:hypothetical protein